MPEIRQRQSPVEHANMIPARTHISFNMHCTAYSSQRTDTVKPALGTYRTHPELSSEVFIRFSRGWGWLRLGKLALVPT